MVNNKRNAAVMVDDDRDWETIISTEQPEETPLEAAKLGRQRPDVFRSTWCEVAFVASILGSMAMGDFAISGFQVVLPAMIEPFHIPHEAEVWPASSLTLVAGALLLPFGRLTDMYGGYIIFSAGMAWFSVWTFIAGFSTDFAMLIVCRAMEGLGCAAFLPAGISILGRTYRPGPRKNLVFSLYGAAAPLGFFAGILLGGLAQTLLSWRWYFWIGGTVSALCGIGTFLTAPRDYAQTRKQNVEMDWWGVATTVPGLTLLIYALTESTQAPQGWASPQILVTFIIGLLFLLVAIYVEGWVAKSPLIPAQIFRIKYMKRMLACLFITWGLFAVFLFYANFYIEIIAGVSPLLTAVWFAPWAIGGIVLATTSGFILHVIPGRVLLIISGSSKIVALLFFALAPSHPDYWAWVFPAMIAEVGCLNILWTVSNLFLTTSLPHQFQGLAGALINVVLFAGGAFFLAIADIAVIKFEDQGMDLKMQYQGVFWMSMILAVVALGFSCSIKLGRAGHSTTSSDGEASNDLMKEDIPDFITVATAAVPVQEKTEHSEPVKIASYMLEEYHRKLSETSTAPSEGYQ